MKTKFILIASLVICSMLAFAQGGSPVGSKTLTLGLGSASLAAGATNTTAGTFEKFSQPGREFIIYVQADGLTAGATNTLRFYFSPGFISGTTNLSTNVVNYQNSDVYVDLLMNGTNTARKGLRFYGAAMHGIQPTAIINNSTNGVTNVAATITWTLER